MLPISEHDDNRLIKQEQSDRYQRKMLIGIYHLPKPIIDIHEMVNITDNQNPA